MPSNGEQIDINYMLHLMNGGIKAPALYQRMRARIEAAKVQLDKQNRAMTDFQGRVTATLSNLDGASKESAQQAADEIYTRSIIEVPRDTSTLASSAYKYVTTNKYGGYTSVVGYGGNGDPINWKSGFPASMYAQQVHEDLSVEHKTGKAKFLEDPVRAYLDKGMPDIEERYIRTVTDEFGINSITGRRSGGPTVNYINIAPRSDFNWPGVEY